MVLALLVKPAVWGKPRSRAVVESLVASGAVVLTSGAGDQLRQEVAALGATRLVACGGDGTVHLAVNAVAETECELAIVPMGTGNDIAGHFGVRGVNQGLAAARGANVVAVDAGVVECAGGARRYFAGVASCGFDAHVNERANRMRGPQGAAKYLAAVVAEVGGLSASRMTVADDHGSRESVVTLVAMGNTTRYGGGMRVCPDADPQDGLLTVTTVAQVSRRTLLTVLPRVFTGSHTSHPAVTVAHTSRIELDGAGLPVYADGERVGVGPVAAHVVPRALRLVLPA